MFECAWCRTVSDEEPISCSRCGELKCPDCIPGGEFTPCLDCEEAALGVMEHRFDFEFRVPYHVMSPVRH